MTELIREFVNLDKLVHEPHRFAILTILTRCESTDYVHLQRITDLTYGNLATHLAKLEKAGLIEIQKRFVVRRPKTRVVITEAGRTAVEDHWRRLREIDEKMKRWQASEPGDEE